MSVPLPPDLRDTTDENLSRSGPDKLGRGTEPLVDRLLSADERAAARAMRQLWVEQDKLHEKRRKQWRVNALRRAGVTGVVLLKRTDTQEWQVYAPPGSARQVPALNKAARLCRLLKATIFTDPPEPEATPSTDSDEDRDGAEFATRVLQDLGAEGTLDNAMTAAQAFDLASTYGSGFRYYYMDGQAGGMQPVTQRASRLATRHVPNDPKSGVVDPATGVTYPGPYLTRYVTIDNEFVDAPNAPNVRREWLPGIAADVLSGKHVRFLPASARDIWQAHGVVIAAYLPLGRLRLHFPGKLPEPESDEEKNLLARGPQNSDDLLPGGKAMAKTLEEQGTGDDALVFTVRVYYKAGAEYPKGYCGMMAGDSILLHRGHWWNTLDQEPLDLPLDQFKQIDDEDDPYGIGMMQVLGPGNEIRGSQLGGMLEHLERFLNRKVFYPINSSLQPKSIQAATGTYIPITPGGEPKFEQVPDFPKATMDMFGLISAEMEHESGLEAPATGQNPSSVQSGLHARTIIEQVHVGLSDIQQNTVRGLLRGWRLQLQFVRAFYSQPRRIGWVGDDGAYKEREWTRADLHGTRDVRLHKGSLSMLAPSAKAAVAEQMAAMQVGGEAVLTASELRRIVVGNVGGLIGLQDNPHLLRVRRQCSEWAEGPPEDWRPPPPPMVDPTTGQPMPPPPDPVVEELWRPIAADEEPYIAKLRMEEIGRTMASTKFLRWPPEWRGPLEAEYLRMRTASGLQTIAEQQAAMAQQQQAQQQQEQAAMAQQQEQVAIVQQVQQALAEAQQAMEQSHQQVMEAVGQQVTQGAGAVMAQVEKALTNVTQAIETVQRNAADVAETVAKMPEQMQIEMEKRLLAMQKDLEARMLQLATSMGAKPTAETEDEPDERESLRDDLHEARDSLEAALAKLAGPKVFTVQRDADGRIQTIVAQPTHEA